MVRSKLGWETFTFEQFLHAVRSGEVSFKDGYGYYSIGDEVTAVSVYSFDSISHMRNRGFTHVRWHFGINSGDLSWRMD